MYCEYFEIHRIYLHSIIQTLSQIHSYFQKREFIQRVLGSGIKSLPRNAH